MKKVSIIIPVFNEKRTINSILSQIQSADTKGLEKELVIVDDNSQDGTRDELQKISQENASFKVIYHEKNYGKGAAIQTGKQHITGDIVIIQDADLEYSPDEYRYLIEPILDLRADVVYGSRFMGGGPHRVLYFWHYLGNQVLTLLSNAFTNLNLTDMETCYKAFHRDIFDKINIEEPRFGMEPEITAKIAKLNCRIYEIGISYYGRNYKEGKKITWLDGIKAIYYIIKYNLLR